MVGTLRFTHPDFDPERAVAQAAALSGLTTLQSRMGLSSACMDDAALPFASCLERD
jgi:hypothetical protein